MDDVPQVPPPGDVPVPLGGRPEHLVVGDGLAAGERDGPEGESGVEA